MPYSLLKMFPFDESKAKKMFEKNLKWMKLTNATKHKNERNEIVTHILVDVGLSELMQEELYLQLIKQTHTASLREKDAWKLFNLIAEKLPCPKVKERFSLLTLIVCKIRISSLSLKSMWKKRWKS